MKKRIIVFFAVLILNSCASSIPPSEDGIIVPLDRAIREAAQKIKLELKEGTVVAVFHFNSFSPRFDDYVMQEMELALTGGGLVISERKYNEAIIAEINKEYRDGYVQDDKLVSLAGQVGAQVVIVGDLFDMNDTYRFRIRAVSKERMTIETAYATDVHPQERKVRNLMRGVRPKEIQIADTEIGTVTPGFFEQNKDRAKMHYLDAGHVGVSWSEGLGVGAGFGDFNFYFSPLHYLSLGIGLCNVDAFVSKDPTVGVSSFLPLYAGVLFPITDKITLVGYGTLNWLGIYGDKNSNRWLIGSGAVGIAPGIKAGLLFDFWSGGGLSVNYKGYWIKDGYINSVRVGFWFNPFS